MAPGYTEIAGEDPDCRKTKKMNHHDEATPLASNVFRRVVNNNSKPNRSSAGTSSSSSGTSCWPQFGAGVTVVTLTAALGALLWTKGSSQSRRGSGPPPFQVDEVPTHPTILYRPLCEYYGTPASVGFGDEDVAPPFRLVQTSMKEPSQLWSEKSCFPSADHGDDKVTPVLNAFGAPDAVFRVNFSAPAFERNDPILGFGGAFTEAAALNYQTLTKEGQDAVMELLFGKSGLGYSLGRVHMNSCDFSVQSYSFDETEGDFDLTDFDVNVQHDARTGMIDMALRATSVHRAAWAASVEAAGGGEPPFKLYASPWSPPAWMKLPTWEDPEGALHASKMTYSAQPVCLRDGVGPDSRYARTWALYFSKYLTAYKNLGLPMWAVTVQNEPEFPAPWEACSYTPDTQKDFVRFHLGPRLREDHPDVKLFIFDHNKDHVNVWAEALLNASSEAAPFVDGTAYHWYAGGMDRLLDGAVGTANLHRLQSQLERMGIKSSHLVLGSESCHCPTTGYAGGDIAVYWSRAERYAHTILADLAAGSHGWVEWNLILDGIGGPNHLGNLCEATMLAVPHRAINVDSSAPPLPEFEHNFPMGNVSIGDGRTREELNALGFPAKYLDVGVAVQPIYYYMGHISRYVRPGSMAVMGLVTQALGSNRIFRPEGQVVAGGGQNDLARDGIELTVWPCEGSTRQQFSWDVPNRQIQVYGHDWLGHPTKSCVGRAVDVDLKSVLLTSCTGPSAGVYEFIPVPDDGADVFKVVLQNHPKARFFCLVITELQNNGGAYGPMGGAQVALGSCDDESAKWRIDQSTGEAMSTYFADSTGQNEVCLTTGWPFLQMGAFLTPNGDSAKSVIVLNEAGDAANYAIQEGEMVLITCTIPPRSIQTVLID